MSYDQKYDNRQPGSNNRNGQSHGNRQSGGNNRNGQRFGNRQNTENYRYKDYKELTNDNYVEYAEEVIDYLLNGGERGILTTHVKRNILTTSQIRNLLSLNSEIYNIVISESGKKLSSNVQSKLQYLKVRMVYDSGRDNKVNDFVMNASLIKHLDEIGDSREKYMLFAKFMEALVAYREFKVNRDE